MRYCSRTAQSNPLCAVLFNPALFEPYFGLKRSCWTHTKRMSFIKRILTNFATIVTLITFCGILAVPAAAIDTQPIPTRLCAWSTLAGLDAALIRVCGMSPLFLCI